MTYSHHSLTKTGLTPAMRDRVAAFHNQCGYFSFQQHVCWFDCVAGEDAAWLITTRGNKVVATSIMHQQRYPVLGKSKFLVHGGPVYADFDALQAHLDMLRSSVKGEAVDIRINPSFTPGEKKDLSTSVMKAGFGDYSSEYSGYSSTVLLDLSIGGTALMSGFSSALKRQIKKSEKLGITVKAITDEKSLSDFARNLACFCREKGVGMPGVEAITCLFREQILKSGQGCLLGAFYHDQMVSGIAMLGCGKTVIYAYGFKISDKAHRKLPFTHLLHREAIVWARKAGYKLYDFGGYDTENEAVGTNRFKLGFSKQVEEVAAEYRHSFYPSVSKLTDALARLRSELKRHSLNKSGSVVDLCTAK